MGNSMYEPRGFAAKHAYGVKWRGRGYIHLTWKSNYEHFGVAGDPSLAAQPATAANIAITGMVDGSFRHGNTLERYIPSNGGEPDFYNARWIINSPTRHERGVARTLAGYADDYLSALKGCRWGQ